MQFFDKKTLDAFQKWLYLSNIHDALIRTLQYNWNQCTLSVELVLYGGTKVLFCFFDVALWLYVPGNEHGRKDMLYAAAIGDFFDIEKYNIITAPDYNIALAKNIHFLFLPFSGDEIHIISNRVGVQIDNG